LLEIEKIKEPKCCHTCDHYTRLGVCNVYKMEPPEEFAATIDACDKWEEEKCPF
jgi:hypothetical protein